jgi:hypothetical protein
MNKGVVEIPIEVWESFKEDISTIAKLHKECFMLSIKNQKLRKQIKKLKSKNKK